MTAWIVLGVALFWALLLWRVRVERGRVERTEMEKLTRRMVEIQIIVGGNLIPAMRKASEQMRAFSEAYRSSLEQR